MIFFYIFFYIRNTYLLSCLLPLYTYFISAFLVTVLIGIVVGSVVFANEARGIKNPIRNVDSSTSLDKAGDPVKVSLDANPNCEICTFIKYIPGPIGKSWCCIQISSATRSYWCTTNSLFR